MGYGDGLLSTIIDSCRGPPPVLETPVGRIETGEIGHASLSAGSLMATTASPGAAGFVQGTQETAADAAVAVDGDT